MLPQETQKWKTKTQTQCTPKGESERRAGPGVWRRLRSEGRVAVMQNWRQGGAEEDVKGQESQTGAGVPGRSLTLKHLRWPGSLGVQLPRAVLPKSAHCPFPWNVTALTSPSVLFRSFQKGSTVVKV